MLRKKTCIVIGLGKIGFGYNEFNKRDILTHSKAIVSYKNFKLIAGIDTNKSKRKRFSRKYKTKSFDSLSRIKERLFPDIIIVATPTNSHLKIINEILLNHSSVSAILCEKPFGTKYLEAKKIVEKCKKKKVKLYINYMRRADPGAIQILKKIKKNIIKKPIKGTVFYDGSTLNQASHFVNLLQFWFGEIIRIKKISNEGRKKNKLLSLDFYIEFKDVKIVFNSLNIKNFSYASAELLSPSGRLYYSERGFKISWQKVKNDKIFGEDKLPETKIEKIKNDMKNYQLNVIKQLDLAISGKKSYLCDGNEAVRTLRAINKII